MNREEVEAINLGAALPMPRGLVQQEVRAQDLDLDDNEAIEVLAKKFQVSTVAMGNRLQILRMLAYEKFRQKPCTQFFLLFQIPGGAANFPICTLRHRD